MNKRIILSFVIGTIAMKSFSQVNPHAIGLRFGGDGNTNGAEISYQHGFSGKNRLELDLGFRTHKYYNNMYLAGIYHWDWNIKGGLNWYVGPGAALGFYNYDNKVNSSSGITLAVGGQIGLEYNFKKIGAPILLSLDTRPMFEVIGYDNNLGWGTALGLRYVW